MKKIGSATNVSVLVLGLSLVGLSLLCTPASATPFTIDTTPVGDGSSNGRSLGYRDQQGWNLAVGQTFTAPQFATAVNDFTFWIDDVRDDCTYGCNIPLTFTAILQEWNSGSLGSMLWQSSSTITTNNYGNDGYEEFTFFPDGAVLTPNRTYIAYLLADVPDGGLLANGRVAMGGTPYGTPLPGGPDTLGRFYEFQERNGGFNWLEPSSLPSNDLAFRVNSVPEPSSLLLLTIGLIMVTPFFRRYKSRVR